MPVYEHECRTCRLLWEEVYKITDDPPEVCPECGSSEVYRTIGSTGFILNGSGWARDGYYRYKAYDKWGKGKIEVFDKKEDHDRVVRGEAEQAELKKLKRLDEVSRKTLGQEAGVTQAEAEKKIKKAGDERVGKNERL